MKRPTFSGLSILMVLILFIIPTHQTQETQSQAGAGGSIVLPLWDTVDTYNPLISLETSSSYHVWRWLYPKLLGMDSQTNQLVPNVKGSLATGIHYDDTGSRLTIMLRQDAYWSDGVQITATDYLWSAEAIRSGKLASPYQDVFYQLADGTLMNGVVHQVRQLDDFTLEFHLGDVVTNPDGTVALDDDGQPLLTANCAAINALNRITVVPSHVYAANFDNDLDAMWRQPYFVPSTPQGFATFGAFTNPQRFDDRIILTPDHNYPDTELGYVAPSSLELRFASDNNALREDFFAGEYTAMSVPLSDMNALRATQEFPIMEFPASGYTYLAWNMADPTTPLPGRDSEGNLLDQGIHPIFGDPLVRQAFTLAIDVNAIIGSQASDDRQASGALAGNGYRVATHNHPALGIDVPDLTLPAYDPQLAKMRLAEAGWADTDDDELLECVSCLYAVTVDPSYAGTELAFELNTNIGGSSREIIGEMVRDQLAEIGADVQLEVFEFATLIDRLLSQQFDAIILGWVVETPFEPDNSTQTFFGVDADVPATGLNFVSYQNLAFEHLLDRAKGLETASDDTYSACDLETRNDLYAEALRLLAADLPYTFLYAESVMWASQPGLENFDPRPHDPLWNVDAWIMPD